MLCPGIEREVSQYFTDGSYKYCSGLDTDAIGAVDTTPTTYMTTLTATMTVLANISATSAFRIAFAHKGVHSYCEAMQQIVVLGGL